MKLFVFCYYLRIFQHHIAIFTIYIFHDIQEVTFVLATPVVLPDNKSVGYFCDHSRLVYRESATQWRLYCMAEGKASREVNYSPLFSPHLLVAHTFVFLILSCYHFNENNVMPI